MQIQSHFPFHPILRVNYTQSIEDIMRWKPPRIFVLAPRQPLCTHTSRQAPSSGNQFGEQEKFHPAPFYESYSAALQTDSKVVIPHQTVNIIIEIHLVIEDLEDCILEMVVRMYIELIQVALTKYHNSYEVTNKHIPLLRILNESVDTL